MLCKWSARLLLRLLLLGAFICTSTCRPPQNDGAMYTDPARAGPDYEIQGEYLGQARLEKGEQTWGAQVIALGNGKFHLVLFHGGLPGMGWKRGDEQLLGDGQISDSGATFQMDQWSATIRVGTLTVFNRDMSPIGVLKKMERKSPTLGAKPPARAVVLFEGTTADTFKNGKIVMGNLLAADCTSKQKFGDHSLHVEFRTPFKPNARGQARGNSGVYVQSRYEIQVLDSFGLEGKDDECGGIYSIAAPVVNMCLPPLTWQTYDLDFTAARYDSGGKKIQNARITMHHNGVMIHDNLELSHGTPGPSPEGPAPEALYLQGHGDPVVFRNIWAISK